MADAWVATRIDGARGAVAGAIAGIDIDAVLSAA